MASLTLLVIHVCFYVSCVKAFFCKKDIICSGHQFCCNDDTECCNLTEVHKLWWFWYVVAVVLFLIFNLVLALCRFRRTSSLPDLQVQAGRPMYGSVTLHLPPPQYNPPSPYQSGTPD
ncbi:uncharacterized protein [Magallana gigas]|uniref:Uncharacterized protein n=1 Tax=Magallana gigas TaxID=29159 RepID=A0A8W8MWD2_MAGGI|nr:uncharacterized protein LOC105341271 [Crassostrea gigas]|eukprot:XP_019928114.1 PREDICTED: uncharacterized protein LOC105341271 [Crassostrea gigas]